MRAKLEENGWTHVGTEVVPNGHSDFYPQLSKYRRDPPDLMMSLFTAPKFRRGAGQAAQGTGPRDVSLRDVLPHPAGILSGCRSAADGLVWAPLFFDAAHNPAQRALSDRIRAAFNVAANADHALAYCITAMLLDNIARADSIEPDKLSAVFPTTDFNCAVGRWRFNRDGHDAVTGADGIPMPAAQVQGGTSYVIWPPSVATGEFKPQR